MAEPTGKELFAQLALRPDSEVDLGLGALLIAEEEYPELERQRYVRRLDELADEARRRLGTFLTPRERVEALARLLAREHGFHGNQDDYYDPRNSFLNDVLERRLGIPITLAVVYVEVGRRAGLPMDGVGFPAHFLARHQDVVFDPFSDGRILSEDDCRALLAQVSGGSIAFRPELLAPTPAKQVLARMLNNLKQIYVQAKYYRKAIGIIGRLLTIEPRNYEELRDRGAIRAELKQFSLAKADLGAYVQRCQDPERALQAQQAIENIDRLMKLIDE